VFASSTMIGIGVPELLYFGILLVILAIVIGIPVLILVQVNKINKKVAAPQPVSAPDELSKWKQLLDNGIITAEEFEKQKQTILSQ